MADNPEELEESLAVYEASEVDVTINVDDTMCKGVESWAWYGLQPINQLTKPNGTLLVTSRQETDALVEDIHQKDSPYGLAVVTGTPSFSGLWVYKDDNTDVPYPGRPLPGLSPVGQPGVHAGSHPGPVAQRREAGFGAAAYDRTAIRPVEPGEGNTETPFKFDLLGWTQMEEGLVIRGIEQGGGFRGGEEGYEPVRNSVFKKFSTRSMRPVINFETCIKCTLCWLQCPDTCFDVTPDGLYDANMESCCGCGVCEAVCPVPDCVTMVNEAEFNDNNSQWEMWQQDKPSYSSG